MYNSGKIIAGLAVFFILATLPFLLNLGKANAKIEPSIDTSEINAMPQKHCVEPKAFMRSEHMQLLNNWRDQVVRNGNLIYVGSDGNEYSISLQNGCMKCHSNKKEFCDKCHNYMAVAPYCWSCHIAPKEAPLAGSKPVTGAVLLPEAAKLYFEVSRAELSADAAQKLSVLIEYLKSHPDAGVDISGYVDRTGDPEKNEELAKNRAKAVRELLEASGVAEGRITMKKPEVVTGTGSSAEARRVEVSISGARGV
ncbi:MAG TPA: sulfate reduction electron transfer complex DsrMKJOP subunit DsrJ [Thermodesulfovibrionales bacterium]|nr:sulfate reduction electron transfer complex DsrMKJOP subunit DsrJ [Thermodesulfovibrionales bacterium]